MRPLIAATALTAGMLAVSPVVAQVTAPASPGDRQAIPEKQGQPIETGRSQSLSKKLNDSDGVIRPKENVDPGMRKPTPDAKTHSTPVIPPSATGGDTAK